MVVVTENMSFGRHGDVNVIYDNDYVNISNSNSNTKFEFINGWNVADDSGIVVLRNNTSPHNIGVLTNHVSVVDMVVGFESGYYKEFAIALGLGVTTEMSIDLSGANLINENPIEPEPEPEPEPEIIYIDTDLSDKFNIDRNYNIYFNGSIWELEEMYNDSTGDYSNGYITKKSVKGESVTIEIEIKDGFLFDGINELYDVHYNYYDFDGSSKFQTVVFEPHESGTIELQISTIPEEPEPEEPEPEEPEPDVTFNNIYVMSNESLAYLSKLTPIPDTRSFSESVINLVRLPLEIDDRYLTNVDDINIGSSIFEYSAKKISNDLIVINVGEIHIPEIYHNSYDYLNVVTTIHLPYSNKIEVDSAYIIGEMINIEYVVNLYNGDSTVNIYSSKIDDIFHSESFKLGSIIPFVSKANMTNTEPNLNIQINNNIKRAYVEVLQNIPYSDNQYNNHVDKKSKLINESGFLIVENIDLKSSATLQEKEDIKNILRSGVFIK